MNFDNQLLNDSIPEWKHNNIDYDLLLAIILTKQWPLDAKRAKLVENIKKQLEIVNIFVSLKVKESARMILSLESSLIGYFQDICEIKDINISKRKLKLIINHTKTCSKDLEKLSKFIILHKVAIRKLKEQIKVTIPGDSQELLNEIENLPEYKDGYENVSFLTLDLSSYLLELSLIIDVINDLKQKLNDGIINDLLQDNSAKQRMGNLDQNYNHSSSISNLTMGQKVLTKDKISKNVIKSATTFDKVFLGESESLQKFVLLKDDLENFKFTLLSTGFQLVDDHILSTSRDIIENASIYSERPSLLSKKSVRSFHELPNIKSHSSLLIPDVNTTSMGTGSTLTASQNQFLNTQHRINPNLNKTNYINLRLLNAITNEENYDIFTNDSINLFPNIILDSQAPKKTNPIVMCHIGGFRDHCITNGINSKTLSQIISNRYQNNLANPIDRTIADWINNHNLVKVGPTIFCKRARFVLYLTTGVYLLSLEENIESSCNTSTENKKCLPYSVFELRRTGDFKNKKSKILQKLFDNLIQNQVNCYPIEDSQTIWKMCLKLKESIDNKDKFFALLLENQYSLNEYNSISENEFFALGKDIIKQNHSDANKQKATIGTSSRVNPSNFSKHQSFSVENRSSPKFRYWNEFDDEPEYATGFYIDNDNQSINSETRDSGLIKFNKDFINVLYDTCQQFRRFLYRGDNTTPLIHQVSYGEIAGDTIQRDELQQLINYDKSDINENIIVYEKKHDEVVSIMYLSSLAASVLISGITLSVVLELFREENQDTIVVHETFLIVVILIFLILSLLLICMTLLLLFSRYSYAPVWHYTVCVALFSIVLITVCYGFIELFF